MLEKKKHLTVVLSFSRLLCGIANYPATKKAFHITANYEFARSNWRFLQKILNFERQTLVRSHQVKFPYNKIQQLLQSEARMAKVVRQSGQQKLLENVNEEAVVSSSSGFLSGEEDAVTSSKGKERGRKAKKELVKEVSTATAGKKAKPKRAAVPGRGKTKLANGDEKKEATIAENEESAIVEKKPTKTKGRGKKLVDVATVEDNQPAEEDIVKDKEAPKENGNLKNVKVVAKRGRRAAVQVTETNIVSTAVEVPSIKGRGRGRKKTVLTTVADEETTAELPVAEEPIKQRRQKKPIEIPIAEQNQNGATADSVKDIKKKATKRAKVNVEQIEPNEEAKAIVEPKKTKSRNKAVKQEPEEKPIVEAIDASPEKQVKGRGTKRKAVNKEPQLEKKFEEEVKPEPELSEEAEEEKTPIANKKSKREPKEKKQKETKPKARSAKSEEKDGGEQLDNGNTGMVNKPQSRKRGAAKKDVPDENDQLDGVKPAKVKKTDGVLMNSIVTKYNKEDFKLRSGEDGGEKFNLKISSWNVAGLRSWLKKDGLRFLEYELPDIFCLQEIKCTTDQLPEEVSRIPGYHPYWLCMPGGYAGVAIYSKIMPINVEYGIGNTEFDAVGRLLTAEYEKFYLINVYVPNSGRKLVNLEARMRWEKLFQEYVKRLDAVKPIVICGDMNVSHQAIDLANPKTNTRSAGFTQEERDKMTELLGLGYVDTFRHFYPDRTAAYTYWTYMSNARSRNVGWRLDYFIVSERFTKRVVDNCIRSQVMGSDHCPITLFLEM